MSYTCSGTVKVDDILTSGIDVRLYRRSDGAPVGSDTTTVAGTFSIASPFNEYHFAIAMSPGSGTNSLIYDWIYPTVSG
jgi:hypothetical protein